MKRKRGVRFEYRSLEQSEYSPRVADPWHTVCQRGNWYFIGYCHSRGEPRLFAFSRIRKAALTKETFGIPTDFNPEEYFDKEVGVWASSRMPYTVELQIDKEIGTYALDRRWHSTQEIKQNEDGSVYLKYTTNQLPEVFRWVLGQGHTVKALNPPELVDMVKAEIEKVRGMYG